MINDDALNRTIKAAVKAGLNIHVQDNVLQVIGQGWAAEIPMQRFYSTLRTTLGTLVTMLGAIPEEGDSFRIWKSKEGWDVQDMIPDTIDRQLLDGEEDRKMLVTPLYWGRWRLWQAEDGTIVGQTAGAMGMGEMPAALDNLGALRWTDYSTMERVSCTPYYPDDPEKLERWKALESVRWVWTDMPEEDT